MFLRMIGFVSIGDNVLVLNAALFFFSLLATLFFAIDMETWIWIWPWTSARITRGQNAFWQLNSMKQRCLVGLRVNYDWYSKARGSKELRLTTSNGAQFVDEVAPILILQPLIVLYSFLNSLRWSNFTLVFFIFQSRASEENIYLSLVLCISSITIQ